MNKFFEDLNLIARRHIEDPVNQYNRELILLDQFCFHISRENILDGKEIFKSEHDLEEQICKFREFIKFNLRAGAIYKVTDLQLQLYRRLLEKKDKTPKQQAFQELLAKELRHGLFELLCLNWRKISKEYETRSKRPSHESLVLKKNLDSELSKLKEVKCPNKRPREYLVIDFIIKYLQKNPSKKFSRIINKYVFSNVPLSVIDALFNKDLNTEINPEIKIDITSRRISPVKPILNLHLGCELIGPKDEDALIYSEFLSNKRSIEEEKNIEKEEKCNLDVKTYNFSFRTTNFIQFILITQVTPNRYSACYSFATKIGGIM